ncbi:hypothetical protein BU23DRAFT_25935 [Bimuria novae-zelandiae CBS 107.79]|uniref:Secreted protein n=1 Tax=Bimuria novae-zelandiae CBS 107.79 TaxID=1447943 RepID=A0A6A5UKW3_9PLEO|nr:hypothetical protein BU23DRAFT_25935 [Bimuria novae-zelandiae CBS 107.79]
MFMIARCFFAALLRVPWIQTTRYTSKPDRVESSITTVRVHTRTYDNCPENGLYVQDWFRLVSCLTLGWGRLSHALFRSGIGVRTKLFYGCENGTECASQLPLLR